MTLRVRLFLTALVVAVPLAVAWFFFDSHLRLATKEQELRRSVDVDISTGLQERCEADPPRTGRPGRGGDPPRATRPDPFRPPPNVPSKDNPGPSRRPGGGPRGPARGGAGAYEYFAYDVGGRSSSADAPPLPADRDGADALTYWTARGRGVAIVVPLGGDGPCAFLLARIPPRQGELRDQAQALALVIVTVLVAAWVAAGPLIGRLQRLADGVRRSAASRYEEPVRVEGQDELGALARAFNEAGQSVRAHLVDVKAREEALRAFVANTTHDVAIPLTVLQGHLAELDTRLGSPEERAHVRAAVQEAHYMASLLRNLAAATTLDGESPAAEMSPVNISALVERVVTRHRPIARASGVELDFAVPDPPVIAPSDDTLLEQALSNLVDNAIRYNRPGGHVAVLLDTAGAGFVLSVADDGPGVTDEELAQMTSRWFRGSEARTRRPDGRGLGLAIAAAAVERLGFSLTFSRPLDAAGLRAEIRPRGAAHG